MKMAIKDMHTGDKFFCGSTPCMKVRHDLFDNNTDHVSLITGYINFIADLTPDTKFVWLGKKWSGNLEARH